MTVPPRGTWTGMEESRPLESGKKSRQQELNFQKYIQASGAAAWKLQKI